MTANLTAALIIAKSQFKPLSKSGLNPDDESNFSTLQDVLDSISTALHSNNLLLTQPIVFEGSTTLLKTYIELDGSKEIISSSIPLDIPHNPLKFRSLISHYRCLALISMLALPENNNNIESAKDCLDSYSPEEKKKIAKVIAARIKWDRSADQIAEYTRRVHKIKRIRDFTDAQIDELCKIIATEGNV